MLCINIRTCFSIVYNVVWQKRKSLTGCNACFVSSSCDLLMLAAHTHTPRHVMFSCLIASCDVLTLAGVGTHLILNPAITERSQPIRWYHQAWEFSGIPEFSNLLQFNRSYRSQSQLSVELWILKIGPVTLVRFSKFKVLQKAGTEIYWFLVKYKSFENLEFRKNYSFRIFFYETWVSCLYHPYTSILSMIRLGSM